MNYSPVKVLVTGPRDFKDEEFVWKQLDWILAHRPFTYLIHGGAKGVDTFAENWLMDRSETVYPPLRSIVYPYPRGLGKAGGPIRNRDMLNEKPSFIVAFKYGRDWTRGTGNMVEQARAAGYEVIEVTYEPFGLDVFMTM